MYESFIGTGYVTTVIGEDGNRVNEVMLERVYEWIIPFPSSHFIRNAGVIDTIVQVNPDEQSGCHRHDDKHDE